MPSQGVWGRERRSLTIGIALSITVVAFEALSVATILPLVSRELGGLRLYGWVFSAFLLASLLGIVFAGTIADRGPLGRVMAAGLGLFAAGLAIGGLAPDMGVLVAGRAVQGVGAGVVPAVGYVAISRGYPEGLRPRMFAVLSSAWVVPGLVGPAAAAVVATTVGWRWVFLGLLPLVGVAGALAVLSLRHVPPPGSVRHEAVPVRRVLMVITGATVVLAAATAERAAVVIPGVLVGGVTMLLALRRLTPAGTLTGRRGLPATVLTRGLLTLCFYAGEAYVPYALTTVRHAAPALAALALVASTLTWTAGSWVQAHFVRRSGPRQLVRTGECLTVAGLGVMGAALVPAVPAPIGILAWGLAGAGMGLLYSPLTLTTLDRAAAGEEGKATSALQLCDVLGQALGTGAAGAIVAAAAVGIGHRVGVALAFALGAAAGVAALALSGRIPPRLLGSAIPGATPPGPGDTGQKVELQGPLAVDT